MKTVVIAGFPGIGKSYAYNNYRNIYSILDSDSSKFSWIYDEDGNKTDKRNPNFIEDYIAYIKENIGKYNIIFVSTHIDVRKALADNKINFVTVYPKKELKDVYLKRYEERGSSKEFINNMSENWDSYMDSIGSEPYGKQLIRLSSLNSVIDLDILRNIVEKEDSKGEVKYAIN